jgi:glycosyltransferase involved in cell wall biosynthesis/ubiquinone/menaquinone biosynthesis C-methylase UbiE
MPLLSVLVPLFNEEEFVGHALQRVLEASLPAGVQREIIVVDDGSTDASAEIVEDMARANAGVIRLLRHARNRGKGAAIRTAIDDARGDFAVIQDADLEYDPAEYGRLLAPLLEGRADVVFGSRFLVADERRVLYFWHALANHALTTLANIFANLNLTDMETCYKAFRTPLLQSIPIKSDRFGIEPELTIKMAQRQARIYEVPISYHGRTYAEGKKIGFWDAVQALFVILRFGLFRDIYKHSGGKTLEALTEARNFNRWMADTIRPYVGEHVLEIGAGIGNLTQALAPKRKRYIATDIDTEHLARLATRFAHRPNVRIRLCNVASSEDFADFTGSLDSVICLNVLEHVEDDLAGLRNIHAALKSGGRAIILVPHDQRIFGTLDVALGHYRRYSREELRARMEQAGFRVEQLIDFNRISRYPWYMSGRILKRQELGVTQMKIFDRLVWIWRKLDPHLPWPPTSIIAAGVKP